MLHAISRIVSAVPSLEALTISCIRKDAKGVVFEHERIWSLDIAAFESVEVGSNKKNNKLKRLTLNIYTKNTHIQIHKYIYTNFHVFKLLESFRIIHRAHVSRMQGTNPSMIDHYCIT